MSSRAGVVFVLISTVGCVYGQTQPDVLVFTNGERLIGHLVRSKGNSVTFKSDMAGEVTVDWSKIQELRSADQFAVIRKDVKLQGQKDAPTVPQGPIVVTDQRIAVTPAGGRPPETIPVTDAGYVVSEATFQAALHRSGIFEAWKGTVTAGVSVVRATQNSRDITSNMAFVRAIPTENWLQPRNRTIVDFSSNSGRLSQPNTPTIKTSIYHADAERDQYFTRRVYGFGLLAYDHSFSQGLDLQQTYGGGIGYTVINNSVATLDVKGNFDYIRQSFQIAANNHNLIAASVAERYTRSMARGIVLNQQLSFTPALNEPSAFSAFATAGVTAPVYKRLNFSVILTDGFLNDPPPGFKKNAFQLTTGVTYTLP